MNFAQQLLLLTRLELIRILRQSRNLLILLLLFLMALSFFLLIREHTAFPLRKVALIIEDDSVEIQTLIYNITDNRLKDIVAFERMDYDQAMKALDENRVCAALHIKKDLFFSLNRFHRQSLDLYIADENDPIMRFLVQYIDNLTQLLNEAQKSVRIYLRQMKSANLSEEQIYTELTKVQFQYITSFLSRSQVFSDAREIDSYFGLGFWGYYCFSTVLIFIFFLTFAILSPLRADLTGLIERLYLCGHSFFSVYLSRMIAALLLTTPSLLGMNLLCRHLIGTDFLPPFSFHTFLSNLLICLFVINLTLTLLRYTVRSPFFDWLYNLLFFLLCLISGLIVPLPSLGRGFEQMESFNPLTLSHHLLAGKPLTLYPLLTLLLFSGGLFFLLYLKERR